MCTKEKNIILFVGNVHDDYVEQIIKMKKKENLDIRIGLIINFNIKHRLSAKYEKELSLVIRCDSNDERDIKEKISDIKDEVLDAYIIYDKHVDFLIKIIKILKLKNYSSSKSLRNSVNKLESRKIFNKYCPEITPRFIQIKSKNDFNKIIKKIGFPCILKPVHLTQSRLVSVSKDPEELKSNLDIIYRELLKNYNKIGVKDKPSIIAEEMVQGDLYTTDVYVDKNQKMYFTPLIYQITGKNIGINDFHIYARINPSGLKGDDIKKAFSTSRKGIVSLGLKNDIVHVELMRSGKDFKIIEVGPRIGGYRIKMLDISYGINHIANYINLRLGKKIIIKNKLVAYSTIIEILSEEKGKLRSISGKDQVRKLKSFYSLKVFKKTGEDVGLAKDGYSKAISIILKNKNKKIFYNDMEKVRELVKIKIKNT